MNEVIYYTFKTFIVSFFALGILSGIVIATIDKDEEKRGAGIIFAILQSAIVFGIIKIL
jgi:hypothetical protein